MSVADEKQGQRLLNVSGGLLTRAQGQTNVGPGHKVWIQRVMGKSAIPAATFGRTVSHTNSALGRFLKEAKSAITAIIVGALIQDTSFVEQEATICGIWPISIATRSCKRLTVLGVTPIVATTSFFGVGGVTAESAAVDTRLLTTPGPAAGNQPQAYNVAVWMGMIPGQWGTTAGWPNCWR